MCKVLFDLGFGRLDAEVYVFLAVNASTSASALAGALGVDRRQIYNVLGRLEKRQIVSRSQNFPPLFSALSFDRVLDLLAKDNLLEAKAIEQKKMRILNEWFSYIKKGGEG